MIQKIVLHPGVHFTVIGIDLIIFGPYSIGPFHIQIDQGVNTPGQHSFGLDCHLLKIDGEFNLLLGRKKGGSFSDIHGKVAHPFEIVIYFHYGNNKTQVNRHRLVESQNLEAFLLYGDFHLVYFGIALDHRLCQCIVSLNNRHGGLIDPILDQAAHFDYFFFQLRDVFL